MSVPEPVTRRRTALGGALAGLVALSGCDDGDPSDGPAIGPSTGATGASDPPDDPDAALVEQATAHILDALATALSTRTSRKDLRGQLTPVVRMHEAHLVALGFEGDRTVMHGSEVGSDVLAALRRTETRLQRQLTDAAVAAESGALAKVLASMAAAIAQRLVVLPT